MPQKSPFTAVFLVLSLLLVSACSRHAIYETAINLERSAAGLEADNITVGELDIAYLRNSEANNGDTIVLIHGFGANKDNWTRIARATARAASRWTWATGWKSRSVILIVFSRHWA